MALDSRVLAENPETDLAIASAMVDELEEYLVKDDLYRTVIVPTPRGEVRLQMTGGDLLTRLHRLHGERSLLTPAQQETLDLISQRAEQTMYNLKTRFHLRLQREFKARLDSLKWFLDESSEDRARARANYPYEIRNRQRIEEIVKHLGDDLPAELAEQLRAVDRRLRQLTVSSEFIWDDRLRSVFPLHPYWYLYASL